MKILRLDLEAYGPFTNCTLDLSGGAHGFHLIKGDNEAGKTVTQRAIQGLLFEISPRTTDNFVHAHGDLRIGARLINDDGATIDFVRRKGRTNTLLSPGAKNAPMPEDALTPFLRGLNGSTFQKVYGIGHAELKSGGRELQQLKGLAGESLFAAGLGITGLTGLLDSLTADAKGLYEGRANSRSAIRVAIKKRLELNKAVRAASVSAPAWNEMRRDLDRLEKQLSDIVEGLRTSRQKRSACERLKNTLDFVGRREALRVELEALDSVLVLPAEYSSEDRVDCERSLRDAREQGREIALDLEGDDGLEARVAAIEIPEELLGSAMRISSLQEKLGAYRNFREDLPKRTATRKTRRERGAALLREVGADVALEDAGKLLPGSDVVLGIRNLAGEEQRVHSEPMKLSRQVTEAKEEIELQRSSLGELPESLDTTVLKAAAARILKAGDLEDRLQVARAKMVAKRSEAERQRKALGVYSGSLDELEILALPPVKTLERFQSKFGALDVLRQRLDDAAAAQGKKKHEAALELKALQRDGQVPTSDDLQKAREDRERGWKLVRASWLDGAWDDERVAEFTGESSDSEGGRALLGNGYEQRVETADQVADRLRSDADVAARIEQLRQQELDCGLEIDRVKAASADVDVRGATLQAEWLSLWTAIGVAEPLPPAEMLEWQQRVKGVRDTAAAARELGEAVAHDEGVLASYCAELDRLLQEIGEAAAHDAETLASLLGRAGDVITANADAKRARENLEEAIREAGKRLARLEREQQSAAAELDVWKKRWATALGILACDANATSLQVYARIDRLAELGTVLADIAELDQRIDAMGTKLEHFEAEVKELSGLLVEEFERVSPEDMATVLAERVGAARDEKIMLGELQKQLNEKKRAAIKAKEREIVATARLEALCALAQVASHEALPEAERASNEKMELKRQLRETDRNLLAVGGGATIEALIAEASGKDASIVGAEIQALDDQIHADEERQQAQIREMQSKELELQAVKGSADAAIADEHALGLVGKIQEDARQYIRLRLARELLRHQIARNRAETENPMIKRASKLFARLTCGSFSGLTIDYEAGDEQLIVGVRSGSGEKVAPDGMSDGTADQLYLALRIAYLENNLDHAEKMPLIVDDILVDFDDERAAATLKVLGELAARTQVIFLTHHEHLRDLARTAVPKEMLFEHELASPGRGAATSPRRTETPDATSTTALAPAPDGTP